MPSTTDGRFATLRDLLLHHAGRRGWSTQRHIAVSCGLDETALSRFLDGRQDIGAVRTFALFRELGVPVEAYPLAFELLDRSQRLARELDGTRRAVSEARPAALVEMDGSAAAPAAPAPASAHVPPPASSQPPAAVRRPEPTLLEHAVRDMPLLTRRAAPHPIAILSAGDAARLFLAEGWSGEAIAAYFGETVATGE